jgi:hypothetical protein
VKRDPPRTTAGFGRKQNEKDIVDETLGGEERLALRPEIRACLRNHDKVAMLLDVTETRGLDMARHPID